MPTYIINQINNAPNSGFPFTLVPANGIQIMVQSANVNSISSNQILIDDGNVNLIARYDGNNSDQLTLLYDGTYSRSLSKRILTYDGYIPLTLSQFENLGFYANGKYNITDIFSDFGSGIYVDVKQGLVNQNILIKRPLYIPGEIIIGGYSGDTSGAFHLMIGSTQISNTIEFDQSTNLLTTLISNFTNGYQDNWYTDYNTNIYLYEMNTIDQTNYSTTIITLVVESGDTPPLSFGYFGNVKYFLDGGIWGQDQSSSPSLEWDSNNNKSTHYSDNPFPFNNDNFWDNDLSQDGGSNYVNANISMEASAFRGYSYINSNGSYCSLNGVELNNQVILDVSALQAGQVVSGTFTGRPWNWDVIYLDQPFYGTVNLTEGISTLRRTFYIQDGFLIDANIDQYSHWTGEIVIGGGDGTSDTTVWVIANFQWLPDYFKITVPAGTIQYFGPGNWGATWYDGTPITDPFSIGNRGQGGEISFWREKDVDGNYTGNLLAYNVVLDYYYD